MPIQLLERPVTRLATPAKRTEYLLFGKAYTRPANEILYASRLAPTPNMNFYAVQKSMPEGVRMSDAAEEFALQRPFEEAFRNGDKSKDPRRAKIFDDLFARGLPKAYMLMQWTSTGLRVPAGLKAPKSYKEFIDGEIHDVYHFIVLEGDKEAGEALAPLGDGRIVTSWNEVNGIPRTTTNENLPYGKHTTHWYVNLNPSVDPVSGKRDVAVGRGGLWLHGEPGRCLLVGADDGRSGSVLDVGFRPVQGSLVLPSVEEIKRGVVDRKWRNSFGPPI